MQPLLNIAVRAARRAGDLIVRSLDRVDATKVRAKGHNEFVSEVDQLAEREIVAIVRRAYPDHAFHAEETGLTGRSDFVWVIDPLDGTTNFLHGFPQFAVSIALQHRGRLELGVVYDPMRQELYTALRGSGAQRDGRKIRVADRKELDECLVGTGFPYREHRQLDRYLAILKSMMQKTQGLRRPGAAALDLAYVADGRLDGFFEFGLKPWDMAAGALLITEAGGRISGMDGSEDFLERGDVVAGNMKVHAALLKELAEHIK
jgi:myo-inositol-1(or 4)-monophosphatase